MNPRHIYLFSDITSYSAQTVIQQLLHFDRQSSDEITIFINSPGGYVKDFFAIYDIMRMIKSDIRTIVIGQAASCAALIAAVGDTRLISADSEFMLHDVWSFMVGNTSEIDNNLERMKKLRNRLANILSEHTGKTEEEFLQLFKEGDRYFSSNESVAFGLADKVLDLNESQIIRLSEGITGQSFDIGKDTNGLPEVQILREGHYHHSDIGEFDITKNMLSIMKDNFDSNVRGIDISVDYTHDNDSGEKPAAFWIKSLKVKTDESGKQGLFASAEFTPKGKKLVLEKEYKYASADFSLNYKAQNGKNIPYVLNGGTLTNRPVIKEMNPIKLSEKKPKEGLKMDKAQLIAMLKDHGVDVEVLQSTVDAQSTEVKNLKDKISTFGNTLAEKDSEIKSLNEKVTGLNEESVNKSKEEAFNALLEQGKVSPAQKESVLQQFENKEAMDAFYKDAPVLIKTKPDGSNKDGKDDKFTPAEQSLIDADIYSAEEIIENRSIESKPKAKA